MGDGDAPKDPGDGEGRKGAGDMAPDGPLAFLTFLRRSMPTLDMEGRNSGSGCTHGMGDHMI